MMVGHFKLSSLLAGKSKGVTLIELLIVLLLTGLVVAAASATINQLVLLVPRNESRMVAIRQVQQAGYWISCDGVMAQEIAVGGLPDFLTLSWVEPDTGAPTTVVYSLSDGTLQRQVTSGGTSTQSLIAENIASIQAQYPAEGRRVLKVEITASIPAPVAAVSETRTYEIAPRRMN